jgi:alpha-L-fucosidase
MKRLLTAALLLTCIIYKTSAQNNSVLTTTANYSELQQKFVDLKFGMFIHFNMPTYMDADWPDPEADVQTSTLKN